MEFVGFPNYCRIVYYCKISRRCMHTYCRTHAYPVITLASVLNTCITVPCNAPRHITSHNTTLILSHLTCQHFNVSCTCKPLLLHALFKYMLAAFHSPVFLPLLLSSLLCICICIGHSNPLPCVTASHVKSWQGMAGYLLHGGTHCSWAQLHITTSLFPSLQSCPIL